MNKNYTNIGVQLMPVVLVVSSVAFYLLGSNPYSITCFLLGIGMWLALFGSDNKE